MDETDRSAASTRSELVDASSSNQPSGGTVAVELSTWEWQLVCRVLRQTSQTMAATDVGARIVGDRLVTVEDRISTQVATHRGTEREDTD
jgi:hypothetical protein